MKLIFAVITGLCLAVGNLSAQVVMNLQLPSPGINIKPQLWNMSLVNSTGRPLTVRVEMTISDISTNQLVLSGSSKNVTLVGGPNQFTHNDFFPIIYNAANPSYQIDNSPEGFLPVGHFNICYAVVQQNNDALDKIAEDCETVEIEPLSPPQLILPADNEKAAENRPLFSWIPPMPYQLLNRLTYDLVLVEVNSYQTITDAVQQNVPLLKQINIAPTQFQYPASLPVLDHAKLYAWRVYSKNNTVSVSSSETWSFKVQKPERSPVAAEQITGYTKTSKQHEAAYIVAYSKLRIELDNMENVQYTRAEIFEITKYGQKSLNPEGIQLPLKIGQNFLEINLDEMKGLKEKELYQLEVKTGKEKRYLKFQFKKLVK